jgi:hypothetical protein
MTIETVGTYPVGERYVTVSVEPLQRSGWAVFKDGFLAPGVRFGQQLDSQHRTREAALRMAEAIVLAQGGVLGQTGEALLCAELHWAARERLRLDLGRRSPKRFIQVPAPHRPR